MFSHGFMSFAAIGVTVACLLIMGTFTLVAYNLNENLKDLQKENAVLAFVDDALTDEEAKALQKKLEKLPGVADCTFVSREEARDNYVEQYDEDDLYGDLEAEIFRHRYVLHMTDLEQMGELRTQLEAVEGIDRVRADETISAGFITVRNIASVISIAMIAVLLIVSVFIMSNTIKLTTFDRRDEIAIMKMVGATDGFIRWPFVYEGLLLGLCGAVIAFGLQWMLYAGMVKGVSNSDTMQLLKLVPFEGIWMPVALVFLAVGLLVGVGGSLTAHIHRTDVLGNLPQHGFLTDTVLHPCQIGGEGDLAAVGFVELGSYGEKFAVIGFFDKGDTALADILAQGCQEDVAYQAAGEDLIGNAPLQHGLHHGERIGDLGAAQNEHTRTLRLLHNLGNSAVFLFKQAAHGAGQNLLETAEAGLIPVGRGKGVADIQVSQRSQLFHQQCLSLLFVGQLQLPLEEGLFFSNIAHIVQQQDLAILQGGDLGSGGGAADIVDPLDFPLQQPCQHGCMGLGGVVVLIFDVAALMGQQHQLGTLVGKLPQGGDTCGDAVDAFQRAVGTVNRLVDVNAAKDGFALHMDFIQGTDAKSHRRFLSYLKRPIFRYLLVSAVPSSRVSCIFIAARMPSMVSGMVTDS